MEEEAPVGCHCGRRQAADWPSQMQFEVLARLTKLGVYQDGTKFDHIIAGGDLNIDIPKLILC